MNVIKSENEKLIRHLGLKESIALVVGTIIGTGVFLKAAVMANEVGSSYIVMLAWVAAGLLSLAGALAYAELGVLFPSAGGEYVYLKEAYGELPAYLYGWQRFWVSNPGTIAAYAVGAAAFAMPLVKIWGITFEIWGISAEKLLALFLIVLFTLLNCLTVNLGAKIQAFMTALKVLLILFLIVGMFFFSTSGSLENITATASIPFRGWSAFGAAMIAALWAYDGWNNLPMVAGEVKNPSRNLPIALGLGVLSILIIYLFIHLAYFYALPFSEILTSNSKFFPDALPVATKASSNFLGKSGFLVLGFAFAFSAVGAMNGSILTCARVPFAMARDGMFIKMIGHLNARTHSPVVSLVVQGFLGCIMALSGSFDQLTDYVVFSSWIFYALVTGSLFIFRKKFPNKPRSYRAFGYPIVPGIFLVSAGLLLINTLITSPRESLWGLAIICAGIPSYWWFIRKKNRAEV